MSRSIITVIILLSASWAHAVIMTFSDFDGTLNNDRGEDATWITYYELIRNKQSAHSGVLVPQDIPQRLLITHDDWYKYRQYLSAGEGHTGFLETVPLRYAQTLSGEQVEEAQLGYYHVNDEITYSRFRGDQYFDPDIKEPVNQIKEDLDAAKALSKKTGGTHKGKGFHIMRHVLNNEHLTAGYRHLTVRGYPDHAWEEGYYGELKKDGEIEHLAFTNPNGNPLGYWALSHPQFANRFGMNHLTAKKAVVVREHANQYMRRPARELVLTPDGDSTGHYHTFIISEDDPENMSRFVKVAQDITRRGIHNIKFVLFHTGSEEDMDFNEFYVKKPRAKNLKLERAVVVTRDGSLRAAQEEEYLIDAETAEIANASILRRCNQILEGKTPKKRRKK